MEEYFDIVDAEDRIIGVARRDECHGNPALIHRTAHVHVFSSAGELLLQKRAASKDIQPGKWDTAVGGHLARGESYEQAACREMKEEIGIDANPPLEHIFDAKIRNDIESENTRAFRLVSDGPFHFDQEEIDALRFWSPEELAQALGTGRLTPNLEEEIHELHRLGLLSMPEIEAG